MEPAAVIPDVHIHQDDDHKPPEIQGKKVICWTWDGIGNWINGL